MKKTKHFNISVPELGDVPDITQVSNAISDLEDATAGTLEIMKAEMQGTKITLTSVSRKTKRTGYYEGMSIRFKSPQDIEPNYLKTISVDGLGDQTLSVEYKVNRNEYIDIVYEGNKFTAYPVVVQKTDSVSNNSSVLVGTAKGVKTAYDKGVEALNKADQAQSSADKAQSTADGKVSKNGDTMTGDLAISSSNNPSLIMKYQNDKKAIFNYNTTYKRLTIHNPTSVQEIRLQDDGSTYIDAKNLATKSKEVIGAINELNSGKENKIDKKSGFNLDKSDSVASNSSNTIATSLAVKTAYDKAGQAQSTADSKVSRIEFNSELKYRQSANGKDFNDLIDRDYRLRGYRDMENAAVQSISVFDSKAYSNDWLIQKQYVPYRNGDYDEYVRTKYGGDSWSKWHKTAGSWNFNSFCPYTVGDIYITTRSENPSTIWLGTTWDKIEGRFLLGTSGGSGAGATGGSMSKTLSVANMPTHSHSASQSAHSHTQPKHTHGVNWVNSEGWGVGNGLSRRSPGGPTGTYDTNAAGGGTTGSAQPSISIGNAGSGSAFDITPSYYTVHIWKRRG